MTGVLQQLPVEVGQRVTPGTNIARVADPTKLKAQIKIAETQAKDIQINQPASIDTRNGIIRRPCHPRRSRGRTGHRDSRRGARRRASERRAPRSQRGRDDRARTARQCPLCRPAGLCQDGATVGVFKLASNGEAVRMPVHFGRSSVNTIEILDGLKEGDQVILSDTSAYDSHDRIRLN